MKRRHASLLVVMLCAAPSAQAFLGIGDVSFDPASHAELVKLYMEIIDLYHVAREQLGRERQISRLIRDAERMRRTRHPGHLIDLVTRFVKVAGLSLPPAAPTDSLPTMVGPVLRQRYRMAARGYQEALRFAKAARQSLQPLALTVPGEQRSDAIVARSTSMLVAFAANQDASRQRDRVLALKDQSRNAHRSRDLVGLYDALGPRSW